MDRSTWAIAALSFAAGVLTVVVAQQSAQIFYSNQATPMLVPAQAPGPTAETSFAEAKRAVIRTLRDPDSAQFGEIFQGRGVVGRVTVCGEVNSKNGYGGYTGMTPFVYFPDRDKAEFITMRRNDLLSTTDDGLQAYFKDCKVRS